MMAVNLKYVFLNYYFLYVVLLFNNQLDININTGTELVTNFKLLTNSYLK